MLYFIVINKKMTNAVIFIFCRALQLYFYDFKYCIRIMSAFFIILKGQNLFFYGVSAQSDKINVGLGKLLKAVVRKQR